VIVLAAPVAHADNKKDLARSLFELGIEEYKTEQYEAASLSMAKSYALDPQPSSLYALAQSERLNNNCKDANRHYKQLLETSDDEGIIKAVKQTLEICAQIARGESVKEDKATIEQRDAPILQIKTVYRTKKTNDKLTIVMFAGGGVAVSGAVAFFLVGRAARSDAANATSLDEYNDLYDRSETMRWMSYAAAGVGVTLLGVATYRVLRGNRTEESSPVAITATRGGSLISWSGRF
jgi:hypothetical protein